MALKHMLHPVLHGAASTFLGILMLAFSDFDFIYKYFFLFLSALLLIGTFNGLALLPVLLSYVGPPAEVVPHDGDDHVTLPSPEQTRASSSNKRRPRLHLTPRDVSKRHSGVKTRSSSSNENAFTVLPPRRHNSDASLSTIAEESNSYVSSSQSSANNNNASDLARSYNGATSVSVDPEIIVETTTYPSNNVVDSSGRSTPTTQQTTKVTAKFKVEVHSASDQPQRTSGRRSRRSFSRQDADSSSSDVSPVSSVSSSIASSNGGDLGFSEK